MSEVTNKLLDKGFDWADIHFFLQSFDIGIFILNPLIDKEIQLSEHKRKWEQASIAADFEKHK